MLLFANWILRTAMRCDIEASDFNRKPKVRIDGKFMCNYGCWQRRRRTRQIRFFIYCLAQYAFCVPQSHNSFAVVWFHEHQKNWHSFVSSSFISTAFKPKLGEDEHVSQMSSHFLVKLWFFFLSLFAIEIYLQHISCLCPTHNRI